MNEREGQRADMGLSDTHPAVHIAHTLCMRRKEVQICWNEDHKMHKNLKSKQMVSQSLWLSYHSIFIRTLATLLFLFWHLNSRVFPLVWVLSKGGLQNVTVLLQRCLVVHDHWAYCVCAKAVVPKLLQELLVEYWFHSKTKRPSHKNQESQSLRGGIIELLLLICG